LRIHPSRALPRVSHKALPMFKVIGWIVFIIFVIGLLVVTGLFKLVF
jgi:hypothetical protein